MPTGAEIYEENAYKTTEKHLEDIKHTATTLGVSPQAIFGAMAEEVHDYEITTGKKLANIIADASFEEFPSFDHQAIKSLYDKSVGELNHKHDLYDKVINPIFNDVSPFNIKIGTAITQVNKYVEKHPNDDPLNLKPYQQDYGKLAKDMIVNEGSTLPKVAGLMIAEAKDYFDARIQDKEWWNAQSQAYRDGVYVTYYNNGPNKIEEGYEASLKSGTSYRPQPGEGVSAGVNQMFNADKINQYFGTSNYSSNQALKDFTSQSKSEIEHLKSAYPRPKTEAEKEVEHLKNAYPEKTTPKYNGAPITTRHQNLKKNWKSII